MAHLMLTRNGLANSAVLARKWLKLCEQWSRPRRSVSGWPGVGAPALLVTLRKVLGDRP